MPLQIAAINGHEDLVIFLIEKGADVRTVTANHSAAQLALKNHHESVFDVLASVYFAQWADGFLHELAQARTNEEISRLIEKGRLEIRNSFVTYGFV